MTAKVNGVHTNGITFNYIDGYETNGVCKNGIGSRRRSSNGLHPNNIQDLERHFEEDSELWNISPWTSPPAFQQCSNKIKEKEIYTYEELNEIASFLLKRTPIRPKIGIICGSGLGPLAESLKEVQSFPYETIPNFPISTVSGHAGELVFGMLRGIPVMCMKGRFHYYEGYPISKCAMPVRVMKLVGVEFLIATNAAGGLGDDYNVGDIMIIKDHINFMGFAGINPLRGPNEERFGPRFPAVNKAYDASLRAKALQISKEMGIEKSIHEGVYSCLGGPNFETVAELRLLKMVGVNAVGMSTVHEVITACHAGMTVFAFSLITNLCSTSYECEDLPNHEEVMEAGKTKEEVLKEFVSRMVEHIGKIMQKNPR